MPEPSISSTTDVPVVGEVIECSGACTHTFRPDDTDSVQDASDQVESDSMTSSLRVYKQQSRENQSQRLPSCRTLKSASARVVSLPETSPLYSVKKSADIAKKRVVSLPERMLLNDPSDNYDLCTDAYLLRSRVRIESHGTDIPYTPSPPSSPESVIIIADKPHISRGFLQRHIPIEEATDDVNDDGWITWARSPPRPIPALHGPLSLPYARCPSGAEGTIIDEQDNLPRMIWGLEGENVRSAAENILRPTVPSQPTPRKPATRPGPSAVPPRFSRQKDEVIRHRPLPVPPTAFYKPDTLLTPPDLPHISVPQQSFNYEQPELERALSGHGPIDLSSVLRPRAEIIQGYDSRLDLQNNAIYDSLGRDLRSYGLGNELGLDWKSMFLHQDSMKRHPVHPDGATTILDDDSTEYFKPSLSASVSLASLSSLASSRSLVSVDSPNMDSRSLAGQASLYNSPHRLTALEIAQNYRQKQLHQQGQYHQKGMLPTPPNSSSPIWASRVSPHQGSLISPYSDSVISPNLLTPSGVPAIINQLNQASLQQYQHFLQQTERSSNLRTTTYEEVPVAGFNGRKIKLSVSGLAPAAKIQAPVTGIEDLQSSLYSPDMVSLDHITRFLQAQSLSNVLERRSPMSNVQQSPLIPRPPPNSPFVALPLARGSRSQNSRHSVSLSSPLVEAPPSPTSPELRARPRSLSHQHPRSIPLTQLIQRRLSSVPEEDSGILLESYSSVSSPRQRSRSYSTGETPTSARKLKVSLNRQANLAPMNPPVTTKRTPSPSQANAYHHRTNGPTRTSTAVPQRSQHTSNPSRSRGREHHEVANARGRDDHGRSLDSNVNKDYPTRGTRGGRGRGSARGRRDRGGSWPIRGPERVDGGMTVRC
ncbi:unnamed protein product [Somion occarium]